jgi:hypothetical protein
MRDMITLLYLFDQRNKRLAHCPLMLAGASCDPFRQAFLGSVSELF